MASGFVGFQATQDRSARTPHRSAFTVCLKANRLEENNLNVKSCISASSRGKKVELLG